MKSLLRDKTVTGIDIGSRSIELVVLSSDGPSRQLKIPTTFDPIGQCRKLMKGINGSPVIATGYGRKLFAESFSEVNVSTITEIQAYALGAVSLYPDAGTVLDIGGQERRLSRSPRPGEC